MRTKEKEVKTVKLISEIIPAEMNGCLKIMMVWEKEGIQIKF